MHSHYLLVTLPCPLADGIFNVKQPLIEVVREHQCARIEYQPAVGVRHGLPQRLLRFTLPLRRDVAPRAVRRKVRAAVADHLASLVPPRVDGASAVASLLLLAHY